MKTPAKKTTHFFQQLIPFKVLSIGTSLNSSISLSASPAILTKPPIGNALISYSVSPIFRENNFGPIPIENSLQKTPKDFAVKKCPSSCTKTTIPKIKIKTTIFINVCINFLLSLLTQNYVPKHQLRLIVVKLDP